MPQGPAAQFQTPRVMRAQGADGTLSPNHSIVHMFEYNLSSPIRSTAEIENITARRKNRE